MLLKRQNVPWLSVYLVGQMVLVLGLILGLPTTPEAAWNALTLDWTKTGMGLGVGLLAIVAAAFPTADLKAAMVFLRCRNPLPGSRSFSELAQDEPRVDLATLREHHEIPTAPKEQNLLWYRIYQRHQEKDAVRSGHLDYLLFRDLTAVTALFTTLGAAAVVGASGLTTGLSYFAGLGATFLLIRWIAARKGERFVTTVLACESAELGAQEPDA